MQIKYYEEDEQNNEIKKANSNVLIYVNTEDLSKLNISFTIKNLQSDIDDFFGICEVKKKKFFSNKTLFKFNDCYITDVNKRLLFSFIRIQCPGCLNKINLYNLGSISSFCPSCNEKYLASNLLDPELVKSFGKFIFKYSDFYPDNKNINKNLKEYFRAALGYLNINYVVRLFNKTNKELITVKEYCEKYISPLINESGYDIQSVPFKIFRGNEQIKIETLMFRKTR